MLVIGFLMNTYWIRWFKITPTLFQLSQILYDYFIFCNFFIFAFYRDPQALRGRTDFRYLFFIFIFILFHCIFTMFFHTFPHYIINFIRKKNTELRIFSFRSFLRFGSPILLFLSHLMCVIFICCCLLRNCRARRVKRASEVLW